jgi:creatinine amidohydrolase/Fe(II)-dependent formamide hydrolase-like protein
MTIDNMSQEDVHAGPIMLGECTRKQLRTALASGALKAAIIPIGATEQHNEHLTLNLDIALSTYMAQQAALRLYPQVTVAPGCPVGYSPYHMARKGTLTLRKTTLRAYLADVVESLGTHGINTVLIVNGHGGNTNLLKRQLPRWRRRWHMTLEQVSYWEGISPEQQADILQGYADLRDGKLDTIARQTALNHASEEETSIMMAAYPQCVRPVTMREYDAADLDYAHDLSPQVQSYLEPFSGEGWPAAGPNPENARDRARQENALHATVEKGHALIAHHVQFLVNRLENMLATPSGAKP